MNKTKYNFFEQIFTAIAKPMQYFRLTRTGGARLTVFVFLFVFITSLFSIVPILYSVAGPNGLASYLNKDLPAFQFSDGQLHTDKRFEENDGFNYVLLDTSIEKFTSDDIDMLYDQEILISKTNIVIYQLGKTQVYDFAALSQLSFDNSILNKLLPIIYIFLGWGVFFYYLFLVAIYFLTALLFSLVGLIVSLAMNLKVKYSTLYKTSIYGKVTAALLSVVITLLETFAHFHIPGAALIGIMILVTCAYVVYGTLSHNSDEARMENSNNLPPQNNFFQ